MERSKRSGETIIVISERCFCFILVIFYLSIMAISVYLNLAKLVICATVWIDFIERWDMSFTFFFYEK